VREGACIGVASMPQPWTLRLTLNAAALKPVVFRAFVTCDFEHGVVNVVFWKTSFGLVWFGLLS